MSASRRPTAKWMPTPVEPVVSPEEAPEIAPAEDAHETPGDEVSEPIETAPEIVAPPRVPAGPAVTARFGATVLLSYVVAPDVSAGIALHGGFGYDAFSLDLELRADLPTVHSSEAGSARGAPFVASLVPCGHVAWFFGCGLAAAGRVRHSGVVNVDGEKRMPHAGFGLRAGLEAPISPRFAAQLSGELLANVIRPTIHFPGASRWSTATISTAGDLRLVASF